MNSPNSVAMSCRSCGNRWRRVSYTYNFAGVLDLHTFVGLAISGVAMRDLGGAR
jgi:hypothetical protein